MNPSQSPIAARAKRAFASVALLLSAVEIVAQSAPSPSRTSNASQPDQPVQLEAFGVTGSAIKRIEQEKALPILIMDRDLIEVRDAQTPVDLLTSLPQVMSTPLNEAGT